MGEKPTYEELAQRVRELEQAESERKKPEEALRENEDNLRSLFNAISESVFVMDRNGKLLMVNKVFAARLGRRIADCIGSNVFDIIPHDVADRRKGIIDRVLYNSQPAAFEDEREGRWFYHNVWPITDVHGFADRLVVYAMDITDRKQSEIAFRESEERFKTLFHESPVSIIVHDKDTGEIVDANESAWRAYGLNSLKELQAGEFWLDPPYSFKEALTWIRRAAAQGTQRFEWKNRKTTGEIFWEHVNLRFLTISNIGRVLAISIDITDRKRAEDALKESQERFKKFFETNMNYCYMITPDGFIKDINQPALEALGYERDEIVGQPLAKIYALESLARQMEIFEKWQSGGHIQNEELVIRTKTGEERTVILSAGHVFGSNGEIIHSVSIQTDITERKQDEAERARLASAVEQASEIFVITDLEGAIQYVNPAFERVTGYSAEEAIGQNPRILKSGEHDEAFYQNLWQTILSGNIWKGRIKNKRKDGSLYLEEAEISPVLDNVGAIVSFLAVKRDISAEIRMEERLRQVQKMESIGSLAGGIAHDFNNILFPIVGMAELLMEDLSPGSVGHENAQEILKAGKRGSDLVQQILAFSRQAEHKMMPVSIQLVLKEAIKLGRSSIPSYVEISQYFQNDCGLVMADPTQIHQIAMNLITNAFHAVEATGGKIHVKLKETALGGDDIPGSDFESSRYALLSVSDTGCGISPDVIDKIFDPYFTTKEQGKGTGLGLAVVYGIVKEHGGDIKVYSEVGKGSTFDVYLPLIKKRSHAESAETVKIHPTGEEHILLVDDEEVIIRLERQMLERLGYRVSYRTSSPDALKVFSANPYSFDLVITDMTMPTMTGDELARELIAVRGDIPIIICTGFSERIDEAKAATIGIKGVMMKPFVKSEMAGMLRKVLGQAKGTIQG